MTIINRYVYNSDEQITAQRADEFDNYLWVAFAKNSEGNCIIEKQAHNAPTQTYVSINKAVDEIVEMDLNNTYLWVAYNDSTLLAERFNKNNPLSTTTQISKGSFPESPIDIKIDSANNLWILLPGDISGTNAQLLRFSISGILQDTIDLVKSDVTVVNARTMAIDDNGDIWIGTYTDPATIVRVFDTGGSIYDFEVTEIV